MDRYTVESDGYDREVFQRMIGREPAVAALKDRIGRLLPHPESLLHDLFAVLFKLNVTLKHSRELSASVMIHRRLIEAVLSGPGIDALRAQTQLDEQKSASAVIILADRALRALKREHRVVAEELIATAQTARDEETLIHQKKALSHLDTLPEGAFDPETKKKLETDLKREIRTLERQLEQDRSRQKQIADSIPLAMDNEIGATVSRLPEQSAGFEAQMRALGLGAGGDGKMSAEQRLELGERLMSSRKLQLLARLTGAFREVAFEARKKRIARTPQELHAIKTGGQLDRLLPSEFIGLRKEPRALRLDFLRRLVEGQLLQYDLQGPAARGPMVICVDGSGSMQGSKEIWAKAVALTLMEIARRERRRCLSLVFSDGPQVFEVELLAEGMSGRSRLRVQDAAVLKFAEYFPGGGTNFEAPLARAVTLVSEGTYRRGDIVFITDGEAHVSEATLRTIEEKRAQHRFKIRGIEVDMHHSRSETLNQFCDEVRKVSDLTADSLTDLFSVV